MRPIRATQPPQGGALTYWRIARKGDREKRHPSSKVTNGRVRTRAKSGDSWPLVLVRRRPPLGLHPGMAVCTRAFGHDVLVGRFCASSNSRRRSVRANSPRLWRQSHLAFRAVCLRDAGTTGWSRVAAPDSASATRLRRSAARVVGGLRRSGHDDWNDLVGVHVGESGHGSVCLPSAQ